MASLKDWISETNNDSELAPIGGMWYGRIVNPLPTDLSELLYVMIPEINPITKWACRWPVADIPILDAEVLVAFDNRENPWVLSIW